MTAHALAPKPKPITCHNIKHTLELKQCFAGFVTVRVVGDFIQLASNSSALGSVCLILLQIKTIFNLVRFLLQLYIYILFCFMLHLFTVIWPYNQPGNIICVNMVSFYNSPGVLQPSVHIFKCNKSPEHNEVWIRIFKAGIPWNKMLGFRLMWVFVFCFVLFVWLVGWFFCELQRWNLLFRTIHLKQLCTEGIHSKTTTAHKKESGKSKLFPRSQRKQFLEVISRLALKEFLIFSLKRKQAWFLPVNLISNAFINLH